MFYRFLADLVSVAHLSYVAFVVVGLFAVIVGWLFQWKWTCNIWFRSIHLLAISIVVFEALNGITCPLTVWEQKLRTLAGQTVESTGYVAGLVHRFLFFEAPPWVFTIAYCAFGACVLLFMFLSPPRLPRRTRAIV